MKLRTSNPILALALILSAGAAMAANIWRWDALTPLVQEQVHGRRTYLTSNSGGFAVGMTEYDNDGKKTWVSILAQRHHPHTPEDPDEDTIYAYEYTDMGFNGNSWSWTKMPYHPGHPYTDFPFPAEFQNRPTNAQVALNPYRKMWYGVKRFDEVSKTFANVALTLIEQERDWRHLQLADENNEDTMTAGVILGLDQENIVSTEKYHPDEFNSWSLSSRYSLDGGLNWPGLNTEYYCRAAQEDDNGPFEITHPSLAANIGTGRRFLAYDDNYASPHGIVLKYTDYTGSWPVENATTFSDGSHDQKEPCIAAIGVWNFVFACWTLDNSIVYSYSESNGNIGRWSSPASIPWVGSSNPRSSFDQPNVTAVTCDGCPGVLLVCREKRSNPSSPGVTYASRGTFGILRDGTWYWSPQPPLVSVGNDSLNPSIASCTLSIGHNNGYPYACYVASIPWSLGPNSNGRNIWRRGAFYGPAADAVAVKANTARQLAKDTNGALHYAGTNGPYYLAGDILDDLPWYTVAGNGLQPALAVDGDGNNWVTFRDGDSLFCHCGGEPAPRLVFAGSSSAVPGQPSIICYSEAATAGYVGSVVFPVYDTVGGSSIIMYARIDTSQVVLDTIESVANLRDSLPCISIYKTDTLLATFQHGDSVLSVMLADYGPGTTGRPGAWSSPNLVTAHGYHPMSAFEQGGSVLNCVWTGKDGNNYAIQRATNDLSGGMFPSWTAQSDPSGSATAEKGNSVYAGLGVTCWQEKVSGKWVIKGNVRGEETTLVANDTDAYHPQAVAESSAISPSIDQVRVHLLWTEGVTFEVDDGVYDTGETRYKCESLSVSHAGSDATKYNQGAKFLRKALSDSLFCVYADLDGAVMYAHSATGDSWQREVMLTDRAWPAIAEDSSGKRWVVVHKVNVGGTETQEAYYRNGSSWTGPQTLYTGQQNGTAGPAGLSGSSYTTSGIAYAAFLASIGRGYKSVVLAKFNGSTLATYTVATGLYLGDPTLAVEPYKTDSDHVHLSWADNGVVKYCMDTDGRSQTIASKWTSTVTLSNAMVTANHPCIAADRDQIVVAWAQGVTAEIYSRKRSTGSAYNNWQSELNLSNTNTASDYPTIAMGDTVIVAWEEHRSGSDYDVLACINFGDTVNIADNATKSGYPHVLFQNKTSGDTCIPYLMTIWSEMPETNVYEVGYNKLNLKQSGEGQQSAGKITIPMKPALNACRPNPFRDRTQISYQLPSAGNVSLRVYDATGRTVRTLQNGFQKPGAYSVSWDSKDNRGHLVPHGVYFYRLDTKGFRDVKKAVVTR
ncbi:MAG: T9SS type A sorting domain-containing protein [candidate division WOR-3 bacterium]|nr:T9SS type A sorting domain-containing protein [candidate division WOR-3 bacterium]